MKKNTKKTGGKSGRKNASRSYQPISEALSDPRVFADTELGNGIRAHKVVNLFRAVFGKARRADGECPAAILTALLVWPILKLTNSSIHSFCSELGQFLKGRTEDCRHRANILYRVLRREDINWRALAIKTCKSIYNASPVGAEDQRAFVVDDTIKVRRGKKVEGTSLHWDHTESRYVSGHQSLELGIAGKDGFLPVDRQIFMGEKGAVEKAPGKGFRDKRCAAARDMARAMGESKHSMFRRMLKAAMETGFRAAYVLGDAWFGCKENIQTAVDLGLTAIYQMKRGNMKYWLTNPESNGKARSYTAPQLFNKYKRRLKASGSKARYRTYRLKVWINLETKPGGAPRWLEVVLIFSAPMNCSKGASPEKAWVVFLTTDTEASVEATLSIYALRWSVEVYFKEAKQNFGLLAEQSGAYQYAYASVHLAAMRYALIFEAMLHSGRLSYGEVRDRQSGRLQVLCFAGLLWQLFRHLIEGALDSLSDTFSKETLDRVLEAINSEVEDFLNRALHMDPGSLERQIAVEVNGID